MNVLGNATTYGIYIIGWLPRALSNGARAGKSDRDGVSSPRSRPTMPRWGRSGRNRSSFFSPLSCHRLGGSGGQGRPEVEHTSHNPQHLCCL